jgi:hypothetical protein
MSNLFFVPIYMRHRLGQVLQLLNETGKLSSESGACNLNQYLLISMEGN